MFNRKQNILAAALLMACAGSAFAAPPSLDLKVTGTITPGSCTPTFAGDSTISYGNLTSDDLKAFYNTINYELPSKPTAVLIQCASNIGVAISFHDQRPTSTVQPGTAKFGFALHNGKDVGGYQIAHDSRMQATGDDATAPLLSNTTITDKTNPWTVRDFGVSKSSNVNPKIYYTLGSPGGSTPAAYKAYKFPLQIVGYVHLLKNLDLSSEIQLDGLTTIQLDYI